MEIYVATFALLLLLCVVESYASQPMVRTACLVIGVIALTLFAGLRWETGNDWRPYWQYYSEIRSLDTFSHEYDPAFRALAFGAHSLGMTYTGFLLVSSAIYLSLFAWVFTRYRHPCVLLLLFFSIYLLGFMGTQRQTLALGFTSVAIIQCYSRRWLAAGSCLVAAVLFHITAIVSLLALAVPRVKIKFGLLIAAMLLGFLALRLDLVGTLVETALNQLFGDGYLARRLLAYSAGSAWENTIAGFNPLTELLWFAKRGTLVVVFWLLCSTPSRSLNNYLVNLYALSVVLFLFFIKSVPLIALRAGLYFSVFEVVLLYLCLTKLRPYLTREIFLIGASTLAAARLYAGVVLYEPDLYLPYKAVWVEVDHTRVNH